MHFSRTTGKTNLVAVPTWNPKLIAYSRDPLKFLCVDPIRDALNNKTKPVISLPP